MQSVVDDADTKRKAEAQRRIVKVEQNRPFQRPRGLTQAAVDPEAKAIDDGPEEVRVVAGEGHDAAWTQYAFHLRERALAVGQLEMIDPIVAEQHEVVGVVAREIEVRGIADDEPIRRQVVLAMLDHRPCVVEPQVGLGVRREVPCSAPGADTEIEHFHSTQVGAELVEKSLFRRLQLPIATVARDDVEILVCPPITITPLPFHAAAPPPGTLNSKW